MFSGGKNGSIGQKWVKLVFPGLDKLIHMWSYYHYVSVDIFKLKLLSNYYLNIAKVWWLLAFLTFEEIQKSALSESKSAVTGKLFLQI